MKKIYNRDQVFMNQSDIYSVHRPLVTHLILLPREE